MSNKWVEVASFFTSSDAHILRTLLETEDIKVEIFNEQFSSLSPVDSVISGGVKLWIPDKDIDKAEPIIAGYYHHLEIKESDVCPECHSLDISRDYATQFEMFCYAIFGAVLGTGFNRSTPHYKKCKSCGYRW